MSDDGIPQEPPAHEHVDAALMLSFGAAFPGRELGFMDGTGDDG